MRYEFFPLTSAEIPGFDLLRALNNGLLPRHYLAADARVLLEAYVGEYLKEEIAAEALTRNIPAFSRFLEAAAFSNGEIVSYTNIASDCGVSLLGGEGDVASYLPNFRCETAGGGLVVSFFGGVRFYGWKTNGTRPLKHDMNT